MAFMKRCRIELMALGFAAGTMALFAPTVDPAPAGSGDTISEVQARAESADYLAAAPIAAEVRDDRGRARWAVTDGEDTVVLDAHSGELLEVEFRR